MENIPSPPLPGLTSFALDEVANDTPDQFLAAAFFRKIAGRAVRLDILERVEETLIDAARQGRDADETLTAIVSLLGCAPDAALALAAELGWKREIRPEPQGRPVWQKMRPPRHARRNRARAQPVKTNSPFAGLAGLIAAD
jgi:ATP-dependent RNA helicase SUPV3L1/SUV3